MHIAVFKETQMCQSRLFVSLNYKHFTHILRSPLWFLVPENQVWKELFGYENMDAYHFVIHFTLLFIFK